jgi:hypothetical protein
MDVDALTMEERGMLLREAGKMLPLQKDRTHGKKLPTRTRRVIKTEEGRPGKVCLYHDQGAHKGAERKFHEDGDGGQRQRIFEVENRFDVGFSFCIY